MIYRVAYFPQETVQVGGRKEWLRSLSRSCGKYALFSHATEAQLQQYLSAKYDDFMKNGENIPWPCKLAAKEVGLQHFEIHELADVGAEDTPNVWVLNDSLHILPDGQVVPQGASPYIWLGGVYKQVSANIAPYGLASVAGDQDNSVLHDLIDAIRVAYINNFASALFTLGAQVLSVHYEMIQSLEEGVPVALLYGDIACGKSRILDACLSLMGTSDSDHSVKSCPDGQFIQVCSKTTLGVVYDDEDAPTRLTGKIMMVFDGISVSHQGKMAKPRTSFIAAVNMECFEGVVKTARYFTTSLLHTRTYQ